MDKLIDYILNSIDWIIAKIIMLVFLFLITLLYGYLWLYFIWVGEKDIALEFIKNTITLSFLAFLILWLLIIASFGKEKKKEEEKVLEDSKENRFLRMLYDYLKTKKCNYKNDYSDKQKEVWFNKDWNRVFEFIYRINYVQIAVSQDKKFETLMWNLANKIWVRLDTFWTSYYLVKIPYNKLDEKLVEDIEEIIDKTLK